MCAGFAADAAEKAYLYSSMASTSSRTGWPYLYNKTLLEKYIHTWYNLRKLGVLPRLRNGNHTRLRHTLIRLPRTFHAQLEMWHKFLVARIDLTMDDTQIDML